VKRTPARGVKQNLKLYAYNRSEGGAIFLTACLLEHEPASECMWQPKAVTACGEAKASLNRATRSHIFDTKPGELPMGRVKVR
jgi:hypothetical protein